MATFLLCVILFWDKEGNYDNLVVNYIYIYQEVNSELRSQFAHMENSLKYFFFPYLL